MLRLSGIGEDPDAIDFDRLPKLEGRHAVVTQGDQQWKFRLHSYLVHFDGKYWCMWSHGPVIEDNPTQHIRFATSDDGLDWSEPKTLVGASPREGFRYISRGLWVRDGKLIALASHDEAFNDRGRVHFFGKSLQLLAFVWNAKAGEWEQLGVMHDDAINNFPPQKLPSGEWGMLCRDHERRVSMLIGGVESPLSWNQSSVVAAVAPDGFRPEEPDWWTLPDGRLLGLFRDNSKSRRFYRAVSNDNGRSWSAPEKTNFPDATSKFFCLRTASGRYVLISNANPKGRNPLCLSRSDDGVTFTHMAALPIPDATAAASKRDTLQYPHAIEHNNHLVVAFSRNKESIEIVKVPLEEIEHLQSVRKM